MRPERAGMASGVNSTFRQVGIATGIAALGSIFAHQVASGIQGALAGTPAAGRSAQVADAVTNGQIKAVLAQAPASVRGTLAQAATSSFVDALNHIKDDIDGSLSFRWSCRMGVCGSCGMMVNGEPRLTCAAVVWRRSLAGCRDA